MVTSNQVKKIAKLADLSLSSEDENLYADQLSKILDYIDQLNEVDTDNIEPTFNVTPVRNITRDDLNDNSLTQNQALLNSGDKNDGFFKIKGVFNDE